MRQACHMTQEELAFGICSVETLSRIENGRHGVKKETYRALMEKMGRNHEYEYAICTGKDMELLEEKKLIEDAIGRQEYEKAERYLRIVKRKISMNPINEQYLRGEEALIAYYTRKIDAEELVKLLGQAIEITLPDYKDIWEEAIIFPYTEQEILLQMSMANAYGNNDEREVAVKIYRKLILSLKAEYIDSKTTSELRMIINCNLFQTLGELKQHEEALVLIEETLNMAHAQDYGHVIFNILACGEWNGRKLNQMNTDNDKDMEKWKRMIRQAYYVAMARMDKNNAQAAKKYFMRCFEEEL